jgi:hypothetical protein
MIAVEFKSVGQGKCAWCRKDRDEVYDVAFGDKSFVGQMCRGDLLRAIGMKLGTPGPKPATASPAANGPTAAK